MKKFTPLFLAFFAVMQLNAATFTATSNGNWDIGTTWGGGCSSGCVAGVDYPSLNDNVVIPSGRTVTIPGVFTQAKCFKLTINLGGTLNMVWNVSIYHDLTNNGTMTGVGATYFFNPSHNISGTSLIWPTGDWHFKGSRTILVGTNITRPTGFNVIYDGITLTNNGTVNFGLDLKGTNAASTYVNGATGNTTCKAIVMAIGVLNCSAVGNTFIYGKTGGSQSIKVPLTTYHHMTINSTGTKILTGNTVLTGNFLYSQSTFNMANFNFSVGGNWTNNANANINNMATVTFTGAGSITRASTETFNHVTVNGTGTRTLARAIQVNGNMIITAGTLDVSASNFAITCRGNWTKNGGTFNGRNGTVTFNNVNHTIGGTSSTTFNHLTLTQSGTATFGVNTVMTGNFNYLNGLVNCATFDLTVGRNWDNTANTDVSNLGTVTFNGSVPQFILRGATENFNNLTIASTSTVEPVVDITATGTVAISGGTFDVTASNFAVNTLHYNQSGGTFLAQGGTLTLTGNFTHSAGTFTAGTGTVLLNGVVAETIGGAANTAFNNLTCSNAAGVSLTAAKTLTNTMLLTVGNFDTGGFDFTLTSTALGTARIDAVPVGSTLLGSSYVVQRFIPGPAAAYWDYLTPPCSGTTLARWDNVVAPTTFYMSGTGGNDGNACCPTFFSVRRYVEATNTYANLTTQGTSLFRGTGYMVWVASDMTQLASSLLFDTRGTVVSTQTNIAVTLGAGGGFNLIGNPKPSQILWSGVFGASTNLSNSFMILDDVLGNYASWNGATSTGTGQLAGSGGVINSSQGFMVLATAATTVRVPESAKTALTSSFVRTAEATNVIKLKLTSTRNQLGALGMISFIEGSNDGLDEGDLPFMASPNERAPSLKIMSADGHALLTSNVSNSNGSREISLKAQAPLPGMYTISFEGISNFNNYNCISLRDVKTGKVFNLKRQDSYSFLITDPSVSYDLVLSLENEVTGANGNFACRFDIGSATNESVNIYENQQGFNLNFDYSTSTPVTIEVYNALGELVVSPIKTEVTNNTVIVGAELTTGLYIVKVSTSTETVNKKLIRQ